MIGEIKIRERGAVPRGMRREWRVASKESFLAAGELFDEQLADERFTEEHARKAGYKRRKGELQPRGSKSFRRSYTGRKFQQHKHTRPLEFSGDTRAGVAQGGNIKANSNRALVAYPQAAKFNFRHPKSQIRMSDEFRKLLDPEAVLLGQAYDSRLDEQLADSRFQTAVTIT